MNKIINIAGSARHYLPRQQKHSRTIGHFVKNGIMEFNSPKLAIEHAKKRILKALHSEQPFERGIVIKNNTLINEVNGNSNEVTISGKYLNNSDCFVHGHLFDTPLSFEDFEAVMLGGGNSVIAYNPKGEYSRIDIKPRKWADYLPKDSRQKVYRQEREAVVENARSDYFLKIDIALDNMTSTNMNKIREDLDSLLANLKFKDQLRILTSFQSWQNNKLVNLDDVPEGTKDFFEKLNNYSTKVFYNALHQFWQENIHKYGGKYTTNYTNFGKLLILKISE